MKFAGKILAVIIILCFASNPSVSFGNSNPIKACQTMPTTLQKNIDSWNDIASDGDKIISEIDKLASNVNGIIKIESDLKKVDGDVRSAKSVFDTFIPIVTPVSSVKNVFKLASSTFGSIRSKGVIPAKNAVTKIVTETGIKKAQDQLDKKIKPQIQKAINLARQNAGEIEKLLATTKSACQKAYMKSCVFSQPIETISEATKNIPRIVETATSEQNNFIIDELRINSALVKANKTLAFSQNFAKEINKIKKPIKDITGAVNQVDKILNKKIQIKISSFKESFKLKTAFKKVGSIVKKVKKIPGVKNVSSLVNKPIQKAMDVVTKPIDAALKPLKRGLKVPSVDFGSLNLGSLPDFNSNRLPSITEFSKGMSPILEACK